MKSILKYLSLGSMVLSAIGIVAGTRLASGDYASEYFLFGMALVWLSLILFVGGLILGVVLAFNVSGVLGTILTGLSLFLILSALWLTIAEWLLRAELLAFQAVPDWAFPTMHILVFIASVILAILASKELSPSKAERA